VELPSSPRTQDRIKPGTYSRPITKLISGGFRVGVSQQVVINALSELAAIEATVIAHRLMGQWEPSAAFFAELLARDPGNTNVSRPYPFFLAHALDQPVEALGMYHQWQAEWKWDGIRSQLIRRDQQTFLWSRGEELVTERYPEIALLGPLLPDGTVIDGEILPWKDDRPLPFALLQ
jgi:DNA ligase 1